MIKELNARTQEILKLIVDAYVETGAPVGSAMISQKLGLSLSPATIRSVMADLEERGLLYAPHTSAGRLPTDTGLAVFVDGLLELDELSAEEELRIRQKINAVQTGSVSEFLEKTTGILSGLASCAGLVFAPKQEEILKQVEFVQLERGRVLAVLVSNSGNVENRLLDVPADVTPDLLMCVANYLNARISGKTLSQAAQHVRSDMARDRVQMDVLTARVVESGLATLAPQATGGHLFVRGQANLLQDVTALEDLERIRHLFEVLETKETMLQLLQATAAGEGVKIFIGAENKLFGHSGCAMIVAPCKTADARIVGAIGVIGPARLNYGRIIPVINHTSRIVSEVIG